MVFHRANAGRCDAANGGDFRRRPAPPARRALTDRELHRAARRSGRVLRRARRRVFDLCRGLRYGAATGDGTRIVLRLIFRFFGFLFSWLAIGSIMALGGAGGGLHDLRQGSARLRPARALRAADAQPHLLRRGRADGRVRPRAADLHARSTRSPTGSSRPSSRPRTRTSTATTASTRAASSRRSTTRRSTASGCAAPRRSPSR